MKTVEPNVSLHWFAFLITCYQVKDFFPEIGIRNYFLLNKNEERNITAISRTSNL
jgi:hypothetical protein